MLFKIGCLQNVKETFQIKLSFENRLRQNMRIKKDKS